MTNAAGEPILLKEREGGILICRMNRPERMNAMGGGLGEALNDAWFELRDDPSLKVMVITGVGDRAFGTGADMRQRDETARAIGATSGQDLFDAVKTNHVSASLMVNNLHLYKPIIAAINGWAVAASAEMAAACDIRVIESHALMGYPEAKRGRGVKATTHKMYYLSYLRGALELDWTADPMTAERAVELGFANEVVPTGKGLERAIEIARDFCERSTSYLQYHKERVFQSIGVPLAYALATEQRYPPQDSADYSDRLRASFGTPLPGWSRA